MKKTKQKHDYRGALKVVVRLIKDMKGISGWLITAMLVSLASVCLAMVAPSLLGSLTDRVFNFVNQGLPLDGVAFSREIALLILAYVASAIAGLLTELIMN